MNTQESNHPDLPWTEPWQLINNWPDNLPLLFLGGKGRFAMIATDFCQVGRHEVLSVPLRAGKTSSARGPFHSGYWGLLSYDMFCEPEFRAPFPCEPIFYRVNQVLIFDQKFKSLYLGPLNLKPDPVRSEYSRHKISRRHLLDLMHRDPADQTVPSGEDSPPRLIPMQEDSGYLQNAHNAIEDIRKGRFCQINLLRYFRLDRPLPRSMIARCIQNSGGPFSALWQMDRQCLASVSPERFIKISSDTRQLKVHAWPIKGTIHRSKDPDSDKNLALQLIGSKKDQAELHIIVDLMRNDLNRISVPGSVEVLSPGSLRSFPRVHHLQAHISSVLRNDLRLGEFLKQICPGGSITGAPKKEVMRAIFEYEARNRGYFMGSIFTLDDSGNFDSSVLIRTLYASSKQQDGSFLFDYAAGSGLTLNSHPDLELEEIYTKCTAVGNPVRMGGGNEPCFHQ